jgi:phosphate starvation-inducible membrane PsiE
MIYTGTEFLGMIMIYIYTKCHMPPCRFILYIKEMTYKSFEFLEYYYHVPFHGSRLKIAIVAATSLVCVSAMLSLPIVGS